jgi:hypothetical protein
LACALAAPIAACLRFVSGSLPCADLGRHRSSSTDLPRNPAGEIGVHHGKFLLPIVGAADARETAVAIDLFEQQQGQNLDGSGSGSSLALVGNLQRAGLPAESVKLWAANSLDLTAGSFAAKQLPRFRMFSVDGSHRVEAALRDLQLASCVLKEGGVVVVDDFVNQG